MRVTLFLLAILAFLAACSEDKQLLETGISKDLAEYRAATLDSIQYELNFVLPEDRGLPIQSKETVRFFQVKNGDLILDWLVEQPEITELALDGQIVDYKLVNEHLLIHDVSKGHHEIDISFVAGEQSLNRNSDYLYTLFVPARARTCFPVFDQPDLKASYTLTLNLPTNWEAVSNGQIVEDIVGEKGRTLRFAKVDHLPSYLFSFAAGEFEVIERTVNNKSVRMLHRETDSIKVANNVDRIFEWHQKSQKLLEAYTDYPFPFSKMDFVLLPDFQYNGMEHPGNIFYRSSSLMLSENASNDSKLGRGRLIAHEVSHMWFGNLVTMKWFDDVWLKEVFANFMASKIVDPEFPEFNFDLQFLLAHYPDAYAIDRTRGTHPIQQPLDNLADAGSIYGSIIYHKAPIVMQKLEKLMGENSFRDGLSKYLQEYAYSNATWDDLLSVLNNHTEQNLNSWNVSWVLAPGMPEYYYTMRVKESRLKRFGLMARQLDQEQEKAVWWPQELNFQFWSADTNYNLTMPADIRFFQVDTLDLPEPQRLFTNATGLGYGFFNMGPKSTDYFLDSVTNIENEVLRGSLWLNMYELLLRERVEPQRFMKAIVKAITLEKNPLIAAYLLEIAEETYWRFLNYEQKKKTISSLESVLVNGMLSDKDASARIEFFNTFIDVSSTNSGLELLYNIWSKEMDVAGLTFSENDYLNMAYNLALKMPDSAQSILNDQQRRIKNPDRLKRFQFVRQALQPDSAARSTFFLALKNPENRTQENWTAQSLRYYFHPNYELNVKHMELALEWLPEIKESGDIFFPKAWLDGVFARQASEQVDDVVRQFLYRNNDFPKDLKLKLLQSADPVFRSVKVKREFQTKAAVEKSPS